MLESEYREFVPKGESYWEIGTELISAKIRRLDCVPNRGWIPFPILIESKAAFIFVTPRSAGPRGWTEPKQTEVEEAQIDNDKGWKADSDHRRGQTSRLVT